MVVVGDISISLYIYFFRNNLYIRSYVLFLKERFRNKQKDSDSLGRISRRPEEYDYSY